MNVFQNKKLDRLKQWAGERMGGEAKTSASDEFQSLETEMKLRHDGMEKLHSSMNTYVKSMSKRREGEDREKMLPVDVLAQSMIAHGEEFESDSLFGNCLILMGQGNEKVARVQDSYVASASESWLESMERSLAQMKEYQAARRKLESRRLAYDATLSKMQKARKEDFRIEEELRAQRIKYEESSEDVYRRMGDIQESESESMADLGEFLDAELEYFDRCRDILMSVKRQWPAPQPTRTRSRSITAHTAHSFNGTREPSPQPPPVERPRIGSSRGVTAESETSSVRSISNSSAYRLPTAESTDRDRLAKPVLRRTETSPSPRQPAASAFEGPTTQIRRTGSDNSAITPPPLPRNKPAPREDYDDERYERESSPSPSIGSNRIISRSSSNNTLSNVYNANSARKQPPPPPPASRKKPPPPPPPMKKSSLTSAGQ